MAKALQIPMGNAPLGTIMPPVHFSTKSPHSRLPIKNRFLLPRCNNALRVVDTSLALNEWVAWRVASLLSLGAVPPQT